MRDILLKINCEEKEELLNSIVNTIYEGVLVLDNEKKILFLNERFLELGKINEKEIPEYDHKIRDLFAQQLIDPIEFQNEIKRIEQSNQTVLDKIYCKDDVVLERYSKVLYDKNEKKSGRIWCFRDVTNEALLAKSLNESFSKLKRIVEHTLDAVILIDEEGKVILWNPAAEKILEQKEDKVLGSSYEDIILKMNLTAELSNSAQEVIRDIPKYLYSTLRKKQEYIDGVYYSRDGGKKYLETHSFNIRVKEGIWTGLHIRDVTERKLADLKLEEYTKGLEKIVEERTESLTTANKKLAKSIEEHKKTQRKLLEALEKEHELNEMKSRFISTASHEFRNPLTSISFSAEIIKKHGDKIKSSVHQDLVNDILDSVSYLTNLMDDILIVSKSESGKMPFHPESIDVKSLCLEIIDSLKWMMTDKHNMETEFKTNKNYLIDKKMFGLIITNILSNAIKYTPDGGTVKLEIEENNNNLNLIISDDGIGIPEEQQKNIFSQFYRCDNAVNIPGTGLGLDIAKRAVELHNGNIYFTSKVEEGTTFTIEIPVLN